MKDRQGMSAPKHAPSEGQSQQPGKGPQVPDMETKTDPNLLVIRSPRGIRQLTTELREPKRTKPVIGLDANLPGDAPVVSPSRLRSVLDPDVRIHFIATPAMRARLAQRLGESLIPAHGIRIWWPGITPDTDPEDHPMVSAGEDENVTLGDFVAALDRSRPTLRSMRTQLDAVTQQLIDTQQQLCSMQRELKEAKKATAGAKAKRHEGDERLAAVKAIGTERLEMLASMDHEKSMHFSIFTEWLSAMTAADRKSHPLGEYIFGPRFLATVEANRAAAPIDRVAFVCAMLACGRAGRLAGLEPQPLPDIAQARKRREDDAKGWLCKVGAGAGAKRLVYWTHPGGRIEFDAVRGHDELGRT